MPLAVSAAMMDVGYLGARRGLRKTHSVRREALPLGFC